MAPTPRPVRARHLSQEGASDPVPGSLRIRVGTQVGIGFTSHDSNAVIMAILAWPLVVVDRPSVEQVLVILTAYGECTCGAIDHSGRSVGWWLFC